MRIAGIDDRKMPYSLRPLTSLMRRRFGKVLGPYRVWAHRPGMTWMFSLFTGSVELSRVLDAATKRLVCLRVAQLIGCPF